MTDAAADADASSKVPWIDHRQKWMLVNYSNPGGCANVVEA